MDDGNARIIAGGCLAPVGAVAISVAVGLVHGAAYGLLALAASALLGTLAVFAATRGRQ